MQEKECNCRSLSQVLGGLVEKLTDDRAQGIDKEWTRVQQFGLLWLGAFVFAYPLFMLHFGESLRAAGIAGIGYEDIMLSWKGLGIDDPVAVGHDVKWTFEEGSEVVWRHPKHVQLRAQERLDMAGSDTETKIVAAMGFDQVAQAPNYMLTRMAGTWEPRKQPKDMTFEVIDGAVDSNFLSAANLKEADLTNATFGVWTNIAKYAELMRENNTSVWLVTENAIREGSLSPEIRVSND